jgi:hypothetical protein
MACTAKPVKVGNVLSLIVAAGLFIIQDTAVIRADPEPTSWDSASSYSGTIWTCNVEGATSIMVFKPNGEWTEDWKDMHVRGLWKANSSNTEVVVTRADNFVLHYKLNSDKNLVRDWRSITYSLSAWGVGKPQSQSFPSWYMIIMTAAVVMVGLGKGYATGDRENIRDTEKV